jgi:hypothetical protein
MPTNTYTPLANVTLGGSDADITFSSIPATYRDLILVIGSAKSVGGNPAVVARFNGDNSSNYPYVRMTGNGSGTGSFAQTDTFLNLAAAFGINASENATILVQIMDYSATDKHKTALIRNGLAGSGVEAIAGRWASTSAITSISVFPTASGSFAAGTTFSLYGVIA